MHIIFSCCISCTKYTFPQYNIAYKRKLSNSYVFLYLPPFITCKYFWKWPVGILVDFFMMRILLYKKDIRYMQHNIDNDAAWFAHFQSGLPNCHLLFGIFILFSILSTLVLLDDCSSCCSSSAIINMDYCRCFK